MEMLGASDNVGCIRSRFRDGRGDTCFSDGPCVWLLLPCGTNHTLMAKQALVAGHVVRQRFADVVVSNL